MVIDLTKYPKQVLAMNTKLLLLHFFVLGSLWLFEKEGKKIEKWLSHLKLLSRRETTEQQQKQFIEIHYQRIIDFMVLWNSLKTRAHIHKA